MLYKEVTEAEFIRAVDEARPGRFSSEALSFIYEACRDDGELVNFGPAAIMDICLEWTEYPNENAPGVKIASVRDGQVSAPLPSGRWLVWIFRT